MTKINLDFPLKTLSGQDITGTTAGQVLANAISQSNKGQAIKLWDWALKAHNGQMLELDKADTDLLKSIVESNEVLSILSKAQILNAIKSAEVD